ncbi:ABC transporter ATP-binding protein [Caballeronia sp. LZ065]|jgi:NitT/TauT family transport system ATP-binding protein|uniref:ABC transporter ATP-binding protein n=1 Tax=Caballeronia sp. LZ065 TaxID=3038571 RepID=UPI00285ABDCF|nr:ABC transporter ATP-binding protein [Caballeronia sp. LZ065]MDR5784389.1 ABC transporter ATP-binding protein [Caballeronia sp. LZ065]
MGSVCVKGVSKVYASGHRRGGDVLALDNASFEVSDREFCSILGHSGCGKTTMLNLLAGFETPTSGELLVDGVKVARPTWRRTVVFQDYALFPWMTVRDNVAFGLRMKKVPGAEREQIVAKQLRLVGLDGFAGHYPHQLSGGMRQRVSIARALAVDPEVLLMDEPFAALDAQNRAAMQQELGRLIAESEAEARKTMILVTHSIDEAILLSDRIIVLTRRPGRIKADIEVKLPRPRDESDDGYLHLKRRLRDLIHDEANVS